MLHEETFSQNFVELVSLFFLFVENQNLVWIVIVKLTKFKPDTFWINQEN